jgi:anti-anti-sigma regulatory factor
MQLAAKNAILRIATERGDEVETWRLYGSLSGRMADELAASWIKTLSEQNGRKYVVDLKEVTSVDEHGEQVLIEMMRKGARFVARGFYLTSLLEVLRQHYEQER